MSIIRLIVVLIIIFSANIQCFYLAKNNSIETVEILLEAPEDVRHIVENNEQNIPVGYKWVTDKNIKGQKYLVENKSILDHNDIIDCFVCWWPEDNSYGIYFLFDNVKMVKTLIDNKEKASCIVINNISCLRSMIRLEEPRTDIILRGALSKTDAEFIVRKITSVKKDF